jgi:2'-hydroxyisoflavone reductase
VKVLVLGGTRFIGRHLVAAHLERGDEVTILHRGHSPSPFAGHAREVLASRHTPTPEAGKVLAEPWDAVVDTSANDRDDLRAVTNMIGDIGQYVLLSTCGVYRRQPGHDAVLTERSPTIPADVQDTGRASAARKLRCEHALRRRLNRTRTPWLIARLGLAVGTYDDSQRLGYWLEHAPRGGDVLIPMDPTQPIQLIDAHDIARFLAHATSKELTGILNVAGPTIPARDLIDTLNRCTDRSMNPRWVSEEFALAGGARPWTGVPLWLPAANPERILMSVSSRRAQADGLSYRPLVDTMAAGLAWRALNRSWSPHWLELDHERRLLEQWSR